MKATGNIPVHVLPDLDFLASATSRAFGDHMRDHRIRFFALVWFTETKGHHFIDFERFPIIKNKVYLIARNQVHAIPARRLPHARVLVFSDNFFQRIEASYLRQLFLPFHNEGITLPPVLVKPLEQLFALILLEYKGAANTALLLQYTCALLMQLHRLVKDRYPLAEGDDARIVRLFHLIEEHYKEEKKATFYAGHIGLTPKRINEILRRRMAITISQLLYHRLLVEAKRELFHQERSVKEIAYELGFSEQSYFARFFKKHAGITPEQFRAHAAKLMGRV